MLEPLADGPCTNRQLAEAAGVTSPTATRMIDGLVGRGVVTRVEDPADRRAVLISLSDAVAAESAAVPGGIAQKLARHRLGTYVHPTAIAAAG